MKRSYILVLGVLSFAAPVQAAGIEVLLCQETKGGWCESSGQCYENAMPPAEFRLTGIVPAPMGKQQAILAECRDTCGADWEVQFVRDAVGGLTATRTGETFAIDLKTGFFSRASVISGSELGRVAFSFGHCRQSQVK